MKILIVYSGNNAQSVAHYTFIKDQIDALVNEGIVIDDFGIKGKGFCGYLKNLKLLRIKINEFKPDLIHAHYGLSGLFANLQRKVPVVTTYHGSDINNKATKLFSKLSIVLSAHNIFVSKKIKEKSTNNRYRYSVIPCGVDVKLFKPIDKGDARISLGINTKKKLILFAGSFDRQVKNYPLAKKVMSLLPDYELIEFKGFTRSQVAILINAVDAVLMTSFSEGSPQLIKEAIACNCPVISVPVGDVPDLINNLEGSYITSYDPEDISEKLRQACNNNKSFNYQEWILQLGLNNEIIARQLIKIYESILKECIIQ